MRREWGMCGYEFLIHMKDELARMGTGNEGSGRKWLEYRKTDKSVALRYQGMNTLQKKGVFICVNGH